MCAQQGLCREGVSLEKGQTNEDVPQGPRAQTGEVCRNHLLGGAPPASYIICI